MELLVSRLRLLHTNQVASLVLFGLLLPCSAMPSAMRCCRLRLFYYEMNGCARVTSAYCALASGHLVLAHRTLSLLSSSLDSYVSFALAVTETGFKGKSDAVPRA